MLIQILFYLFSYKLPLIEASLFSLSNFRVDSLLETEILWNHCSFNRNNQAKTVVKKTFDKVVVLSVKLHLGSNTIFPLSRAKLKAFSTPDPHPPL